AQSSIAPWLRRLSPSAIGAQLRSEKVAQARELDAARDEGLADAPRQDEDRSPVLHLLVLRHGLEEGVDREGAARHMGETRGQPGFGEMRLDPRGIARSGEAKCGREAERHGATDRDAFAMHEAGGIICGDGLERMAESVAEIEQRAVA